MEHGQNIDTVLEILKELNPDVVLLQEVIPTDEILTAFKAMGFAHTILAGSSDAHVLPATQPSFPNQRLHVSVLCREPAVVDSQERISMGSGAAAFTSFHIAGASQQPLRIGVVSLHLSVRCPPEARKAEAEAVLDFLRKEGTTFDLTVVAGDFNQPSELDYPSEDWAILAQDLTKAQLPLTDGVVVMMRNAGFTPSLGRDLLHGFGFPVRSTAWNGAVVDYIFFQGNAEVAFSSPYFTLASDHLPLVADFRL